MRTQFAKEDLRYWRQKIAKRKIRKNGEAMLSTNYYIRISFQGIQKRINLNTANADRAAHTARSAYQQITDVGWDAYQEDRHAPPPIKSQELVTVGQFIEAVRLTSQIAPSTFYGYESKFRRLVGQVMGLSDLPHGSKKLPNGDRQAYLWRRKVDKVPLASLEPKRIKRWMLQYVNDRNNDPANRLRAVHTVNSIVRNSRALFNKKHIEDLDHITFPEPLPFTGIHCLKGGSMRYRSKVDPTVILETARSELQYSCPEAYKAFILCLLLGLRRKEADLLLWDSIDFDKGILSIERTQYFEPKTESSLADIPLPEEINSMLKQWYELRNGIFVMESESIPLLNSPNPRYRANIHFKRLLQWLRDQGVTAYNPIHTLRKEFGRLITEQHGIYAASRMLRHSNIQITAAHYADDTRRLSTGLEAAL